MKRIFKWKSHITTLLFSIPFNVIMYSNDGFNLIPLTMIYVILYVYIEFFNQKDDTISIQTKFESMIFENIKKKYNVDHDIINKNFSKHMDNFFKEMKFISSKNKKNEL